MTPYQEAQAYRIRAVGESVKWDCTQKEIADETGIAVQTVHALCKAKGWRTVGTTRGRPDRAGIDQVIGGNSNDRE